MGGRDVGQFAVGLVCGIATLGPDEADGRLAPCLVGLVDVQLAFVWAVAGGVSRETTCVAGRQYSDINLCGFFNGLPLLDRRVDDGFRLWGRPRYDCGAGCAGPCVFFCSIQRNL